MTEVFEEQRGMLFGLAYRILGTIADAEDIVQEAWLRWNAVTVPVANPRAYLARTVTNLSLARWRSAAARREAYVGPWLPEPLVCAPNSGLVYPVGGSDPAQEVEMVESISMAMLVVLETLSPLERAVFVLREVFGFSYAEIARTLRRSEDAVRQVGHRARSHVRARRPRYHVPVEVHRKVTEEFLAACLDGDTSRMKQLLAPDVTAWTDGGGKMPAARRPLHGADKIARWLLGVLSRPIEAMQVHQVDVNAQPGVLVTSARIPDTVACLDVAGDKIVAIYLIRNPDKLSRFPVDQIAGPKAQTPQPPRGAAETRS
jgi:RNA polymerase sigma-70 factor, ECF subfamily